MKIMTVLAATSMLALAACDRIPLLQSGETEAGGNAAANAAATNASADAANAGIGSSRSLAGLSGNTGSRDAQGGKDPSAIPAASSPGEIDPALVGRWSDTGDCKQTVELLPDGTFVAPNGAQGRWEVADGFLVFTGAAGVFRLRLDSVEPGRIVTTNDQGQTGSSSRC